MQPKISSLPEKIQKARKTEKIKEKLRNKEIESDGMPPPRPEAKTGDSGVLRI